MGKADQAESMLDSSSPTRERESAATCVGRLGKCDKSDANDRSRRHPQLCRERAQKVRAVAAEIERERLGLLVRLVRLGAIIGEAHGEDPPPATTRATNPPRLKAPGARRDDGAHAAFRKAWGESDLRRDISPPV